MSNNDQMLQAIECPKGNHPLCEPVILPCHHLVCTACYKHASGPEPNFKCPFRSCGEDCQRDSVKEAPVCEIPAAGRETIFAAGVYPKIAAYAEEKAMEPGLVDLPDESETIPWEDIEVSFGDNSQIPEEAMAGVQLTDKKKNEYDFQYIKLSEEFDPSQAERKRDETWDIKKISIKLSTAIADQEPIIGFYESYTKDKIYVDIEKGFLKSIETFISEKFQKEWEENRFEIVEQENLPEFYIVTGAKIIASSPDVVPLIGQHPDNLKEYGTVTCLGIDTQNKAYILTAKHVLNKENRQQSDVPGSYLSGFDSRLTQISSRFSGYLGGYQVQGRETEVQVDVAALPLDNEIVERFDTTLRHKLNSAYTGSDDDLEGVVVNKRGATTGYTSGHIVSGNYNIKYRNPPKTVTGSHFIISPSNSYEQFSSKGDSGSLIWSANDSATKSRPIGLVSMGMRNHNFMGRIQNTTLAVRLDNCLDAMREHLDIDIMVCEAYDAPLPLALPPIFPTDAFRVPVQEHGGFREDRQPIPVLHVR